MSPSAQPTGHHRPAPRPRAGAVKHRACDECRNRKLACTKEPGGCARCKNEGVHCHYSAQKPMGRPRKRPVVPVTQTTATISPAVDAVHPHAVSPLPTAHGDTADVPVMADAVGTSVSIMDPPAAALDADMTGMDMLEFLGLDFMSTQLADATRPPTTQGDSLAQPWERGVWKFDIDFDPQPAPPANYPYPPPMLATNMFSLSSQEPSLPDANDPLVDPALSSSTAPTAATTTTTTDPPLLPVSCACLANLYLALDSTTRLPTEVMPAIRVARSACKAAHETILCRTCCPSLYDTTHSITPTSPSTLTFQNMMVLCALVPAIADAYHRILALVDAETVRALAAHARIPFSLSRCGGPEAPPCGLSAGIAAAYEDRLLEPSQWRLAVRALLKMDVYGVNCDISSNSSSGSSSSSSSRNSNKGESIVSPPPPPLSPGTPASRQDPRAGVYSQVGLRALVAQMEERSRARHEELDALIDAGLVVPRTAGGLQPRHTRSLEEEGKVPPCRHIMGLAKEAVENLVIA